MLLYYLNHTMVFIILVTDTMLIYKEKISGMSVSSHTEALVRKQLSTGCALSIFRRLSQVVAAKWKCSADKHLWMVGEGSSHFRCKSDSFPCGWRERISSLRHTLLIPPPTPHLQHLYPNPPSEPKSYIRPSIKHLLFANLFFPQPPAPFCVCANVPNVYTA